ncbi:family 2 glycosyl transferase [Proteiniclasticum sp. BAD-10]|uniref:Family 2 glycosyl transferase n=1 Tax=Proteiniclasticum sediminis TaxID=2804028 RepID=A0A941CRK1_9CLOT|nr:family 2 glycosyl transferase [Proteiniclasticum sediminis]MBR0576048.1 family 2 glycosyl transferase [Proteiniclasticum sediminis]
MTIKRILAWSLVLLALLLPATCRTYPPEVASQENFFFSSRVVGDRFQVLEDGRWNDLLVKGVNLGMTRPGTWPGEAGISAGEYSRWLEMIGAMNANTIRTYTLHPPAFYEALLHYNTTHKKKIYLFQGVWIDEGPLTENLDVYPEESTEAFKGDISAMVDVIHGNAVIPTRPGHASGTYTADVSPYVLGWILGIEWLPDMVDSVNRTHPDQTAFSGDHVYTEGASPFEVWLAQMLEHTLTTEKKTYGWSRPVSFTNWVSTDLLSHPYEPFDQEDLVTVNPQHLKLKNSPTGYFASYHIYPYYPDFQNYDPKYTEFLDWRGEKNSYAGYLKDLRDAHSIPVLVAEFGIPSSRGLTHENVHGKNQGFMTEKEQGEIVAGLYEDIVHYGYMGGLIFSWQDEWFKRTWNTMDLDNPDRRPYWSNAQTNEQQFGILSFDRHKIRVDGEKGDWGEPLFLEKDGTKDLQALYVDHDERYLYLGIQGNPARPWPETLEILLDNLPGVGNQNLKDLGLSLPLGADFRITVQRDGISRVTVDRYSDVYHYQYGKILGLIPEDEDAAVPDSGIFSPIMLPLNKALTIPATGLQVPYKDDETGLLRQGNANPESPDYDSLADYCFKEDQAFLEIRLPWLLLGFTDPSTLEVQGDFQKDGLASRKNIEGIQLLVLAQTGKELTALPAKALSPSLSEPLPFYTWTEWNEPQVKERLKESYPLLQSLFQRY